MEKVSDGVYHLEDIVGGPTILLAEHVAIVDTGVPGSEEAILAAIAELGRPASDVRDIVITHADGDHVGSLAALAALTHATVWAGTDEADVIEGRTPGRGGDVRRSGAVDRRFTPGETVPLHGAIETVDTRGHTRGHVSLLLLPERILIAGDALNNHSELTGSPPEHTADPAQAREAVRTLAALRPKAIVFGHGPSIVEDAAARLEALDESLG